MSKSKVPKSTYTYGSHRAEDWAISNANFAAFGGSVSGAEKAKYKRLAREREWSWLKRHGLDRPFIFCVGVAWFYIFGVILGNIIS